MASDTKIPDFLREFDDARSARRNIYQNTLEAMKKRFPMEDDNYRLELNDLHYDGPLEYSLAEQKKALLNNRNLRTNLVGTWRLVDKKTGNVLDERKDSVMQVPYWTDRGTIINNGSEYTVISQSRLRPGVYARRKSNGEFEAQFNIKPGTGRAFHFGLNPETGVMTLQTGQGSVPLYQILRGMGVDNKEIAKYWGADVTAANAQKADPQAWNKLYRRMAGYKAVPNATEADKIQFVKDAVAGYEVDPEVVERTLGLRNVSTVTPALMLRASQKLLNISRGDEQPDNRDNPRFSKFYGVEDYFKERVEKNAGRLANTLLYKARRNGNLKSIQRNALNPWVDTIINGSGLAMPGEEANPLSTLEQMSRISKFGLGGIGSKDAVTMEARDVQGDYLGFVDSVQGPESESIGVDVRASYRTFLGKDNKLYGEFIDNRTGKKEYVDIATASDRLVAFPGQDPNAKYVMAIKDGIPQRVPRDEVRYTVPSYAHMVASNTNMNPMPTGVQASRQFYGSKFWSQYLPQAKGETPLVDTLMPDGKLTWREYYGRKVGTLSSDVDGVVTKVDDDKVVIKGDDGKTYTKELTKNVPFNRLSQISYFPSVEVGQAVKAGDMVAHSNYTDKKTGAINMGQNLHVAIIPNGGSFEDAYVISEAAARRMATDRLYSFDHETRNGVTIGRDKFISAYPSKFTKQQVETLDENGIVKPGTILHRGDPMILSLGPKMLSSSDKALGKLSKALRNSYTDRSEVWEHDYEGKVVDTAVTSKGAKVNVSAQPPVRVGDKLSPMAGIKGVVGCYDPATEVLTSTGWKAWPDVTTSDMLAVLPDGVSGRATFARPSALHVYDHDGYLVHACTEQLDYRVTGNHRMYCRIEHYRGVEASYRIRTADDIFGKKVMHLCASEFDYNEVKSEPFDVTRYVDYDPAHERKKSKTMFDGDDFAEFLGWYVSEGSTSSYSGIGIGSSRSNVHSYKIQISQSRTAKPDNCRRIEQLLDRLGVRWVYHGMQYTFSSKPLYKLLQPLGICREKYLPDFVWCFSKTQLRRLFAGLMLGDGTVTHLRTVRDAPSYITTSPRLARQVEFIMTLLGYNARITIYKRAGTRYQGHGGTKSANYNFDKYTVTAKACTEMGQSSAIFSREQYTGKVYCATVPGGLLYVRRSGRPMWCGNSIIPDDQMPRDAVTNQPYDMLMNTMGFLSRVAPNQIIEMNLAKIAKKTGKQIRMPQLPPPEGWYRWAQAQMKAAGVPETADVFDPATGRTMKGIGDGYMYTMAFHHLAEKKASAVGADGSFTQDEQPAKGGFSGGKKTSGMDLWAMLAHNVPDVIKDSQTIRGTRNDQYWRALQLGLPTPEPEEPFIYKKFLNTLRAGGINVTEKGSITKIMPQTDKDIDQLAQGRVLTSAEMVDSDFEPVKGGLFDLGKTGGMAGNQWSMIKLPEPVPNPIMEEPVRRVLGLTVSKMEDILAGREKLYGKTGGEAIRSALEKVDVDKRIAESRRGITTLRGQKRDDAVKVYRYLSAMKEQGLKPQDWMVSKVPVIPPAFRPVSKMGDVALVSDMNELYKDIIENSKNYEELRKDVDDSALADERLDIYNSVKAAYGLGEPITPENAAKGVKGAMRQVIGSRPKFGMFQNKVLSKAVGGVSRGVISPDINLDMDQCGIPEVMAWPMYKPYVMRELVRNGYPSVTAVKMIADKTDTARHILEKVMSERPVILDRAPTWHKFNFMAFKPFLTDGDTIKVSPLIVSGFNADFDGDQMNAHVPSSEKAVRQAYEKMLPSKNLTSMTDMKSPRHTPSKEQIFGLYALTKGMDTSKPPKVFNSVSEAKQAYARGEIGPNDPIEIRG